MRDLAQFFPIVIPLFLILLFLALVTAFHLVSRMSRTLNVHTGPLVRESRWGSANVNGIGINNAVKVVEYSAGWVVQTMWILGGGKIWFPRGEVDVGGPEPARFFLPSSRTLRTGQHTVRLYGRLADFVGESLGQTY
jgi:hypothetical protein